MIVLLHRLSRIVVAAALLMTSSVWADGLSVSDSFESGGAVPAGWKKGANIPGVTYLYDKANGSDGKRSLSLQKSANRYFPIAQWFRTIEHDGTAIQLKVTTKVKAAKATKAIVEVQYLDGQSNMIGKDWVSYIGQEKPTDRPASHSWKDYTGTASVPAGTQRLVVAFQIYGPGKVWFDELRLRQAGAAPGKPDEGSDVSTAGTPSRETVKPQALQLESGAWTRFVMLKPTASPKPSNGYPLLFVLPGGDGSIDFHPFVRSIQANALGGQCMVVQLIAPPSIVWPTAGSRSRFATTEEAIEGIAKKLMEQGAIDDTHVHALAWSSSGPAVYAALLRDNTALTGAFVAMSVFREKDYGSLSNARGKRIHLLHSPEDRTCPYVMAESAEKALSEAGATVQLVDYDGGHGWHGDVMGNIGNGVRWLWQR